jgi:hypothetical protein
MLTFSHRACIGTLSSGPSQSANEAVSLPGAPCAGDVRAEMSGSHKLQERGNIHYATVIPLPRHGCLPIG